MVKMTILDRQLVKRCWGDVGFLLKAYKCLKLVEKVLVCISEGDSLWELSCQSKASQIDSPPSLKTPPPATRSPSTPELVSSCLIRKVEAMSYQTQVVSPPWLADRELSQQQGDIIMTWEHPMVTLALKFGIQTKSSRVIQSQSLFSCRSCKDIKLTAFFNYHELYWITFSDLVTGLSRFFNSLYSRLG